MRSLRARLGRGVRSRIVVTIGLVTIVGMTALVALTWLVLERSVDANVRGLLRDRADAVAAAVAAGDGGPVVAGTLGVPGDEAAWVFDQGGRQVSGPQGSRLDDAARGLAAVGEPTAREVDDWLLWAEPLPDGDGAVVVASPLGPYESTRHVALVVSVGLGVLVVAAVSWLTAWSVTRALRPVESMARSAAAWSEQDLDRRFDLGPPHDEITELGRVLDGLLARVSHAILAEQRLTAELAHELRTPLTVVRAEAEMAASDPDLPPSARERCVRIVAATDQVTSVVETLLSVARRPVATGASVAVDEILAAAVAPSTIGERTPAVTVEPAPGLAVAAPREVALRALAPLVDNALRHARSRVSLRARRVGAGVAIEVEDDGPGVPDADRDLVFEPGHRSVDSPGAGLGLPLARRLARAAGGDVVLDPDRPSRFVLTLPAVS